MTVHGTHVRPEAQPARAGSRNVKAWVQAGTLFVLVTALYQHTFRLLWDVWQNNPNYSSHGFLIPPVALFLVWLKRHELRALPVRPSAFGVPLIALAVLVELAGLRGDVLILQGDSLILLLLGFTLHFGGWPWFRVLAFPIGFLIFMVPFLPVFQTQISFPLKQIAASAAVTVSQALGVLIQRDGLSLYLPAGAMRIENACSGMQSLISLMAVGALLAHLGRGSAWKRSLLFLASIPIAVMVNVVRISSLCIVANATNDIDAATGTFHDASGIVLFAVGFFALAGVGKALRC